jgi:VCBS repeat-containing protein
VCQANGACFKQLWIDFTALACGPRPGTKASGHNRQVVTVTIQGSDDPAVVSGETHGCVVEAGGVHNATQGVPTAIGLLTDTDVDDPSNTFVAVTSPQTSDHGYGSFAMTADGHWTYTLDDSNCVVQALNVGQTLTDTFVVKTVDGTAQAVTITIEGSNDAAVICGPNSCGLCSLSSPACRIGRWRSNSMPGRSRRRPAASGMPSP